MVVVERQLSYNIEQSLMTRSERDFNVTFRDEARRYFALFAYDLAESSTVKESYRTHTSNESDRLSLEQGPSHTQKMSSFKK